MKPEANLSTGQIIGALDGGGGEYPTSFLVRELVKRLGEELDGEAAEKVLELLGEGDGAERYVTYCWLKDAELYSTALKAAVAAFETDPANKRLIEIWRECSQ